MTNFGFSIVKDGFSDLIFRFHLSFFRGEIYFGDANLVLFSFLSICCIYNFEYNR